VGTKPDPGKISPPMSPAQQALHRVWARVAWPLIPLGLLLWTTGIVTGVYWCIVGGTLTIAAGAYKVTDR
jgi:hypothetical protein